MTILSQTCLEIPGESIRYYDTYTPEEQTALINLRPNNIIPVKPTVDAGEVVYLNKSDYIQAANWMMVVGSTKN